MQPLKKRLRPDNIPSEQRVMRGRTGRTLYLLLLFIFALTVMNYMFGDFVLLNADGLVLRDQYGIPDVRTLTGKNITEMMSESKLYPDYPEDLISLFKKAIILREHLAKHKADKHSKTGLEHLESNIRRLIKYYAREGKISKEFQYDPKKVKLIVQK